MNILVIGNGFDIAHGLNTSYSDFLEFVRSYQKSGSFNEELKMCINNNLWLDYFDSVFEERKIEGKDGWIDFESEISTVIEALDRALLTYYNHINNPDCRGVQRIVMDDSTFGILNKVLKLGDGKLISIEKKVYISVIKKWKHLLLEDLSELTRGLEIYLLDFLGECKNGKLSIIEDLKANYVISFNYTKTYENLYSKPLEIDYIHGVISKDSNLERNNLVLGIGEFLRGERKDNDNEFVEFKKFYQRIYKNTGSKYKKWLNEFEANRNLSSFNGSGAPNHELNIYFYGHSLDPTDGDIISDLINSKFANIYIYYHSKSALSKQISNLVRVIGEDRTIELTDKSRGRIKFVSCV